MPAPGGYPGMLLGRGCLASPPMASSLRLRKGTGQHELVRRPEPRARLGKKSVPFWGPTITAGWGPLKSQGVDSHILCLPHFHVCSAGSDSSKRGLLTSGGFPLGAPSARRNEALGACIRAGFLGQVGQPGFLQEGSREELLLSGCEKQSMRTTVLKRGKRSPNSGGRWRLKEQRRQSLRLGPTLPRSAPQPLAGGPSAGHWWEAGTEEGLLPS